MMFVTDTMGGKVMSGVWHCGFLVLRSWSGSELSRSSMPWLSTLRGGSMWTLTAPWKEPNSSSQLRRWLPASQVSKEERRKSCLSPFYQNTVHETVQFDFTDWIHNLLASCALIDYVLITFSTLTALTIKNSLYYRELVERQELKGTAAADVVEVAGVWLV